MVDRATFHATVAPALAAALGVPERWSTKARVSGYFSYFADGDRLLVVAAPEKYARDVDKALAYGLSYAGDRDLWLVLPAGTAAATLDRVAFLDVPVRVFEHDGARATPAMVPSRPAVFARAREPRLAVDTHDLGDAAPWVISLVSWAHAHPDLQPAHRDSYLAWHCRGRMALCLARVTGGVDVVAGVDEERPRLYAPPFRVTLGRPIGSEELDVVRRAVDEAVEVRLRGGDRAPDEHWLQGVLGSSSALGFRPVRELPALRVGRDGWRRAYVDLVGVSRSSRGERVHLVETKLGADEMLVLQGLDYWIWAEANRDLLTAHLDVPPDTPFQVDFVVDTLGVHAASQAEALAGDIPWRVRLVRGWFEGEPVFEDHPRRSMLRPDGHGPSRHTGPRFARRLHLALAGPRPERTFLPSAEDGIVAEAIPALRALEERGLVHPFAAHVRSSQAFALNLFGALSAEAVSDLLAAFGPIDAVEPVAFEFLDDEDRLHERSAVSNHTTQVDVLLRGTTADGARVALLVEVKLSEIDFGACSAFGRASPDQRAACAGAGAFGGASASCAQLANRGDPERRRYDAWLAGTAALAEHPGCHFRLGMNQPMRNLALARMLVGEGTFDRAAYALCAHDDNAAIWRLWADVKRVFGQPHGGVPLVDLQASRVVAALPGPVREAVARRYWLPSALTRGGSPR